MAQDSIETVFVVASGLALLGFAGSVGWGVIGRGSKALELLRWTAFDSPWASVFLLSPPRVIAISQFLGLTCVLLGLARFVQTRTGIYVEVLLWVALGSFVLGWIAVVWPRPFVSTWVREAEDRRKAGLPATSHRSAQGRPMTSGQRSLGLVALVFALTVNLAIGGPLSVTSALLVALGLFLGISART